MKKITIWAIITVAIIAIIGVIVWGYNKPQIQNDLSQKQTIKIGVVAPATGEAASYGEFFLKAFKLGLADFNVTHKNLNFEVIYEDGKCDPKEAVTVTNKLINVDGVKYIIGGFCSGETLAMAPIAESNKVILLSAGSGSPDITKAGDYIFRNLASDDFTAKTLAKIAINNNDKEMGVITENKDYPQTLRKAFVSYFTSNGGKITAEEVFNSDVTDFKTIITKFKGQDIKKIYLLTQTYQKAILVLRQMKELGYEPKIYTNEVIINEEAFKAIDSALKPLLEGAIATQPKLDVTNPKTSKLLADFTAKYGSTEGPLPPIYIATAHDATFLLGEAIINGGNTPDQVKTYFYNLKNWQGAVGNFSFDSNGDSVTDVDAITVKNGKIVSWQ
jgi:branched-chain amino acid transport system substrate-binding protein